MTTEVNAQANTVAIDFSTNTNLQYTATLTAINTSSASAAAMAATLDVISITHHLYIENAAMESSLIAASPYGLTTLLVSLQQTKYVEATSTMTIHRRLTILCGVLTSTAMAPILRPTS